MHLGQEEIMANKWKNLGLLLIAGEALSGCVARKHSLSGPTNVTTTVISRIKK